MFLGTVLGPTLSPLWGRGTSFYTTWGLSEDSYLLFFFNSGDSLLLKLLESRFFFFCSDSLRRLPDRDRLLRRRVDRDRCLDTDLLLREYDRRRDLRRSLMGVSRRLARRRRNVDLPDLDRLLLRDRDRLLLQDRDRHRLLDCRRERDLCDHERLLEHNRFRKRERFRERERLR